MQHLTSSLRPATHAKRRVKMDGYIIRHARRAYRTDGSKLVLVSESDCPYNHLHVPSSDVYLGADGACILTGNVMLFACPRHFSM